MASSVIQHVTGAPSTSVSPPAGSVVLGIDAASHPYTKDTSGNVWQELQSATRAASAAINTTETVISQALAIPVGLLQVGTVIRGTIYGTCTASVANASTFRLRAGTLGTTGDAVELSGAFTSAATGTAIPFRLELLATILTVGTAGTLSGYLSLINQGTTGIVTTATSLVVGTASAINTTTVTNLELTYVSAATTTTTTFANVLLEVLAV